MHKTILALLLAATITYAQNGEQLFDNKCASCHVKVHPSQADRSKFVAPPAFGVMRHVKEAFNGDKEKTIEFIVDYALHPSKEKAKCRAHAIERFGLMPSQQGLVSKEELALIAEYMFNTFANNNSCK
jgi:mono/diheme cytochrome c family protein